MTPCHGAPWLRVTGPARAERSPPSLISIARRPPRLMARCGAAVVRSPAVRAGRGGRGARGRETKAGAPGHAYQAGTPPPRRLLSSSVHSTRLFPLTSFRPPGPAPAAPVAAPGGQGGVAGIGDQLARPHAPPSPGGPPGELWVAGGRGRGCMQAVGAAGGRGATTRERAATQDAALRRLGEKRFARLNRF